HLTEFWMVEPEVAWNDSEANMTLQEEFVSYIVTRALERRKGELAELERDVKPLEAVRPPFPRISYTDAVAKLKTLGGEIEWGQDLGGEAETLLAKQYDRPVMVFNYPRAVKAFYMKENPADPRTVLNNDMLAPEGYGEIIGGSQLEDDYDTLLARPTSTPRSAASRSTASNRRVNFSFARSSAARGSMVSLRDRFTTANKRSPISSCSASRIPLPASRISTSSSTISSFTFSIGPVASGQSNPTPAARSWSR